MKNRGKSKIDGNDKAKGKIDFFMNKTAKRQKDVSEHEKRFQEELSQSKKTSKAFFSDPNKPVNSFFLGKGNNTANKKFDSLNISDSTGTNTVIVPTSFSNEIFFPFRQHVIQSTITLQCHSKNAPNIILRKKYKELNDLSSDKINDLNHIVRLNTHSYMGIHHKFDDLSLDPLECDGTLLDLRAIWLLWLSKISSSSSIISSIDNNINRSTSFSISKPCNESISVPKDKDFISADEAAVVLSDWLQNWTQSGSQSANRNEDIQDKVSRRRSSTSRNSQGSGSGSGSRKKHRHTYDDDDWLVDDDDIDEFDDDDDEFEYSPSTSTSPNPNDFTHGANKDSSCSLSMATGPFMVLIGPTGTGKSALVSACATALGLGVIEIGVDQSRGGAVVRKLASEATRSHSITTTSTITNSTTTNTNSTTNTFTENTPVGSDVSIIFFDEADLVFPEDSGFHSAIVSLAKSTRRPIILTSETPLPFLQKSKIPYKEIHLVRRTIDATVRQLLNEFDNNCNIRFDLNVLNLLALFSDGDLRAASMSLHLALVTQTQTQIQTQTPPQSRRKSQSKSQLLITQISQSRNSSPSRETQGKGQTVSATPIVVDLDLDLDEDGYVDVNLDSSPCMSRKDSQEICSTSQSICLSKCVSKSFMDFLLYFGGVDWALLDSLEEFVQTPNDVFKSTSQNNEEEVEENRNVTDDVNNNKNKDMNMIGKFTLTAPVVTSATAIPGDLGWDVVIRGKHFLQHQPPSSSKLVRNTIANNNNSNSSNNIKDYESNSNCNNINSDGSNSIGIANVDVLFIGNVALGNQSYIQTILYSDTECHTFIPYTHFEDYAYDSYYQEFTKSITGALVVVRIADMLRSDVVGGINGGNCWLKLDVTRNITQQISTSKKVTTKPATKTIAITTTVKSNRKTLQKKRLRKQSDIITIASTTTAADDDDRHNDSSDDFENSNFNLEKLDYDRKDEKEHDVPTTVVPLESISDDSQETATGVGATADPVPVEMDVTSTPNTSTNSNSSPPTIQTLQQMLTEKDNHTVSDSQTSLTASTIDNDMISSSPPSSPPSHPLTPSPSQPGVVITSPIPFCYPMVLLNADWESSDEMESLAALLETWSDAEVIGSHTRRLQSDHDSSDEFSALDSCENGGGGSGGGSGVVGGDVTCSTDSVSDKLREENIRISFTSARTLFDACSTLRSVSLSTFKISQSQSHSSNSNNNVNNKNINDISPCEGFIPITKDSLGQTSVPPSPSPSPSDQVEIPVDERIISTTPTPVKCVTKETTGISDCVGGFLGSRLRSREWKRESVRLLCRNWDVLLDKGFRLPYGSIVCLDLLPYLATMNRIGDEIIALNSNTTNVTSMIQAQLGRGCRRKSRHDASLTEPLLKCNVIRNLNEFDQMLVKRLGTMLK